MSLEEALAANTKALEALTKLLLGGLDAKLGVKLAEAASALAIDPGATPSVTAAEVAAKRAATDMTMKDAKAAVIEEKKLAAKTETKPPATSPTSENTSPESEPVKYDDVKKLILAISKNDRNKAVALLGRYGAKGGLELKPEQFADFVVDAGRVLSGEYDPESGDE